MVNSHVVGRCSFSGPNTSPNRKQPASYWDFSSHTPHDVVQYQPQMKTVYCFVFPSGNMIKKLLDWDNFNQTGWWWWFIREISMLFQAYRSKASHFSTTPSVGVPWISFPTMKKSEGRLLIQRLGIFLLGKLLVQTLRHFFCWTVCKHIKNPWCYRLPVGFPENHWGVFGPSPRPELWPLLGPQWSNLKTVWTQGNASLFSKGCVFQGNAESSWERGKGAQWSIVHGEGWETKHQRMGVCGENGIRRFRGSRRVRNWDEKWKSL